MLPLVGRSSCGGVSKGSNGCSGNDGGNGGSFVAEAKVVAVVVAVEWRLSGSQVEYKNNIIPFKNTFHMRLVE
jgi:hypothetical protein